MEHIAIIGGGQAGATLVETLRKQGFAGRLTLWSEEAHLPYQRPPLSKAYLLGEMTRDRLLLRPASFYDDQDVELHLNTRITGLDAAARTLSHADGTEAFDAAVLATGSAPVALPSAVTKGLGGVHVIRTLADIDALQPAVTSGKRMLVVGGGYIGLEAAAVARKIGLDVTLLELGPRILGRVACAQTADWFRALHRDQGVDLREGVGLAHLTGDGHVTTAHLTDGTTLSVDLVIAGIGARPVTALAETAGLTLDNGIAVDAMGHTSAPGLWAAGDCCSLPYRGDRIRLESVPNAIDQAQVVAANILGSETEYVPKPWFWSDQYDVKLQIAGWNAGFDNVVVRNGDGRSHWYYAGDTLLAVDAMNDARAYMVGKRLIEAGRSPDKIAVANADTPIKDLL